MENKIETFTHFEGKKLDDFDLNTIVGGTNTNDFPKYKMGDTVYVVMNQTPPDINITKIITLQCEVISEPYKGFWDMWCYDVLVKAQDAFYEGYRVFIGDTLTEVKEQVLTGAEKYMAENKISF